MKAHALFVSMTGLCLLAVLLLHESRATAADRLVESWRELEKRIEALERNEARRSRSNALALLQSRVAELERLMREHRGGSLNMAPKADLNDVARLQRENASLRRTVAALELKVVQLEQTVANAMTPNAAEAALRREIDNLRRSLSTLQTTVQRLESRR